MSTKLPQPAFKITRCPTCGSNAIQWVLERWAFELASGQKTTPPVPHWKCGQCGERIFDRVSHQVLDPWRAAQRKKKPARRAATAKKRGKTQTKG